ncbi:hypothetical protein [Virgibacillus pantothenticus]|uniref:hypothetical protein n=1 Tax=Virgibacillus pantothenticus TaxID=1473 RepID=UPI00098449DD|nr:hypothetical protein [Virgibacillus pantothenticus]
MTDKERLEKIKVKYNAGNAGKLGEFIDLKLVNPYDLKYLIERVQELEKDIDEWEIVNDSWEEINTSLAKQNKRYREAIEYAHGELKNSPRLSLEALEAMEILGDALEGEE